MNKSVYKKTVNIAFYIFVVRVFFSWSFELMTYARIIQYINPFNVQNIRYNVYFFFS